MKKRALLWCVAILLVVWFAAPARAEYHPLKGYMHEVDGQPVLHVWGTHYEMGYAQGYLLAPQIAQGMREYVMALLPDIIYRAGHIAAQVLFELPEPFREEAQGMLDGMYASSADTYLPSLGRHIDIGDLVFANALGDIGAMACSTMAAWGPATEGDYYSRGDTAVVRNLDWAMAGPNRYFLSENTVVIVYSPSDPDEQTVVSVTFPGFFGCLTCMNESGVVAILNIAHNGVPLWDINFAYRFNHIEMSLRKGLQARDVNGDGYSTITDVMETAQDSVRAGAYVVNLSQPLSSTTNDPSAVLELDNAGFAVRVPEDEPDVPENILLATNDLRKLRDFKASDRYDIMKQRVNASDGKMTLSSMWMLAGELIQNSLLSTTAQTVYFLPGDLEMGVAFTDADTFSPEKTPAVLTWEDLTELPDGVVLDDDDDDDASPDSDSYCDTEGSDEEDLCCG